MTHSVDDRTHADRRSRPSNPRIESGFLTSEDGSRLFWQAVGSGPDMVACSGVGVSTFWWRDLVDAFCHRHRVITWDYPGHGRSTRPPDGSQPDMSIPRLARDLQRVVQATGVQNPVYVAHSMGNQVMIEHYRHHPGNTAALVIMNGSAGRILGTFLNSKGSRPAIRTIHHLVNRVGKVADVVMCPLLAGPMALPVASGLSLVDCRYLRREDIIDYLHHLATLDQRIFLDLVVQSDRHDAWDVLPTISVPVLIIGAELDTFTPIHLARRMYDRIPDAELTVVGGATHALTFERPETIFLRLDRFLRERVYPDQDLEPFEMPFLPGRPQILEA